MLINRSTDDFMSARHNLRCRPFSVEVGGAFIVQFWSSVSLSPKPHTIQTQASKNTYPTNNPPTPPTPPNQIPRTSSQLPTSNPTHLRSISTISRPDLKRSVKSITEPLSRVFVLIRAAESLVNELSAVLQQVGAKLPASPRELVEGVEI